MSDITKKLEEEKTAEKNKKGAITFVSYTLFIGIILIFKGDDIQNTFLHNPVSCGLNGTQWIGIDIILIGCAIYVWLLILYNKLFEKDAVNIFIFITLFFVFLVTLVISGQTIVPELFPTNIDIFKYLFFMVYILVVLGFVIRHIVLEILKVLKHSSPHQSGALIVAILSLIVSIVSLAF